MPEIDVLLAPVPDRPSEVTVTALQQFAQCELRWRRIFIEGMRAPVSGKSEWSMGQIVHGTLERLFKLPPSTRIRTVDLYPLVLEEWTARYPGQHFQWAAKARNIAEGIFELVHTDVVTVHGVELPLERQVAGFRVTGRLDLMYTSPDGRHVIADYKSHLQLRPSSALASPLHPLRLYDALLSSRYEDAGMEVTVELLGLDPPMRDSFAIGADQRAATMAELEDSLRRLRTALDSGRWTGTTRGSCPSCAQRQGCPALAIALKARPPER